MVSIYETLDDPDMARKVLMKLLENFSDQCEIWLYSYEFEKKKSFSAIQLISKLLERAVDHSKTLDWPERIMQEWLSFEQIQGNIHSYERALIKVDKVIREMSLKRMHIQEAFESESTDKIKRNIDDDEGEQDRSKQATKA